LLVLMLLCYEQDWLTDQRQLRHLRDLHTLARGTQEQEPSNDDIQDNPDDSDAS
jgi:hypothetical protein